MKNLLLIIILLVSIKAIGQESKDVSQEYSKLYNDGTILIGEKKFKEALVLFNKSINLKNTSAEAIFARGTCFLMLNERDKACADFESAKQLKLMAANEYIEKYCGAKSPGKNTKPLNNR